MKKFIVAYVNFFDNELIQHKIEAENEIEAVKKILLQMCREEDIEYQKEAEKNYPNEIEALKDELFNCEILVSVFEI